MDFHPMTPMRERLMATILAVLRDTDGLNEVRKSHKATDAALAELASPSEGMVEAARHALKRYNKQKRKEGAFETGEGIVGQCDMSNVVRFVAMISAAREGK